MHVVLSSLQAQSTAALLVKIVVVKKHEIGEGAEQPDATRRAVGYVTDDVRGQLYERYGMSDRDVRWDIIVSLQFTLAVNHGELEFL